MIKFLRSLKYFSLVLLMLFLCACDGARVPPYTIIIDDAEDDYVSIDYLRKAINSCDGYIETINSDEMKKWREEYQTVKGLVACRGWQSGEFKWLTAKVNFLTFATMRAKEKEYFLIHRSSNGVWTEDDIYRIKIWVKNCLKNALVRR